MTEYEEKEIYVYLDFKGRLPPETFNAEVFFNIVNLNSEHPIVQIGQSVFYGNYEECVGTNVFFEEDEEATPQTDVFSMATPIKLKYVTNQFKILNMQWAKIPEVVSEDVTDECDIKFKENYDTTLKKVERDALKVEELGIRKEEEQEARININSPLTLPEIETTAFKVDLPKVGGISKGKRSSKQKRDAEQQNAMNVTVERCTKYNLLKYLAKEPLKRITAKEQCEIPESIKADYVYHSFKNKLMQESLYFDPFVILYNQKTLEGAVDINRCIRQGLISSTNNIPDIPLETKMAVLSVENFENLSLPMRYCVLRSHMKKQKRLIQSATEKQIQEITEFGMNVRDAYKIMKVIAGDLKKQILLKQEFFDDFTKTTEGANEMHERGTKKKVAKKKKVIHNAGEQ